MPDPPVLVVRRHADEGVGIEIGLAADGGPADRCRELPEDESPDEFAPPHETGDHVAVVELAHRNITLLAALQAIALLGDRRVRVAPESVQQVLLERALDDEIAFAGEGTRPLVLKCSARCAHFSASDPST